MPTHPARAEERPSLDPGLFGAFFARSPRSTQILATTGETLAVNAAWERLWGLTLADLAGYNVRHDPQLEAKGIAPQLEQAFAGVPVELPAITYNIPLGPTAGQTRWVRATATPILDEEGSVRLVVLIHEDVTDAMVTNEQLWRTQELLEESERSARVGSWSRDLETNELSWSDETFRLFGLDPESGITFECYVEMLHPDDRPALRTLVERALKQGESFETIHRIVRRDGSVAKLLTRGRIVVDASGRAVRMIGSSQDVTEQQRAQEDTARLVAIVEHSRDAIHARTLDGIVTSWNPAAEALFGYSQEEVIGKHIDFLVPPERIGELPEINARLQGGEDIPTFETTRRRKDGTLVEVEITLSPVVDATGNVVGVSAITRDVSERAAARRLQQAFLEAVSHDLKNPLAAIRAHAQLIERRAASERTPDPAWLARTARTIDQASRRMEAQLDELQDIVRLRSGQRLDLRKEPADLVALARAAAEDMEAASPDHSIRFASDVDALIAECDPLRVRRILDNLLGNAIKYSPEGSEVTLTLARVESNGGGWAQLVVHDRGVGIPAADLPHIFERYRRGSNVGTKIAGTGIGLSGVQQIVEQHGGSIEVESEEGIGSTFTLRLPLPAAR